MYHALAFGQKRDGSNISEWVIIKRFTRGIYSLTEKIKGEGLMKRRRQAVESQEKGVQAVRLRLADIYGGMISSRLKEDAALPVLAQSIARHGLLQPIVVQENEENGRYMLVCGARRLAACRLLGMTQIDAVQIPGRKPDAAACFLEDHFTRQTVPFFSFPAGAQSSGRWAAAPPRSTSWTLGLAGAAGAVPRPKSFSTVAVSRRSMVSITRMSLSTFMASIL